mmetsp:Transcript_16550/g.38036  ORF Transcript_16550/g.38036 Transcript_16550/m.38036 type:complete len:460 (+) Transcript_16550:230-1609(+)
MITKHDVRRSHRALQQHQTKAFLKCSIRSVIVFLVLVIVGYVATLASFLNDHDEQVERIMHGPTSRVEDANKSVMQQLNNQNDVDNDDRITIGVASTVTGCGSDPFIDGAAILKYSLDVSSQGEESKFKYKNYILYHPTAKECVLPLEELGYTLLERQTPVKVEEIGGDGGLRERIVKNGCCGEKELIKLEAFRLTQHPVVIHLDLDVLINKPMDDVLDFMINPRKYQDSPELFANIPVMWPSHEIPNEISLIYTKDYNVVAPARKDKPYQGGFFMIKPSLETYNEFVDIVRKGDYDVKKGWGSKVGPFYGGMTIQGLLPWYFEYLHPGRSVELSRCKYNNMSDNPFAESKDKKRKKCRTNESDCEDCRFTSPDDVVTFHFTICLKPWSCLKYAAKNPKFELCRQMNRRWYKLRSELEKSWGRTGKGTGSLNVYQYNGFCSKTGAEGYQQIQLPYGNPI